MSLPTVPTAFPDCYAFCEECVDDPIGARRPFSTEGKAIQFRKRCHHFRELTRKQNKQLYPPDDIKHGTSDYDLVTFTIAEDSAGEWWVYGRKLSEAKDEIERLSEIEGAPNGD